VPRIREAAAKAGRGDPRVVCSLPIAVTDDAAGARERINNDYAMYATLPSYAAMLEREGAGDPAGASLIGSRDQVLAALHELDAAGATEFSGVPSGDEREKEAALEVMLAFQAGS
jgi:alkanesulfonate monooxygenase SsuD/methylene tetrahydromethanopterin reductase-like flavin-dependent oxidoreductase (luciferase family)